MKLLRRCSAPGVAVCLICRKPALLLGRLLVALPGADFIAGAIVVCWGYPGHAMRDSSSGIERLRIPRGQKSESAVVLVGGCTCNPNIISKCPFLMRMTRSVPVSFVRVNHYGDLKANFNQGCPSVRRLEMLIVAG
ncbi:hypothetical protein CDL15_Pgr017287 [Punica granatum]|uniref:Uncharacterized protein n=1 Tax=Punica granatum TaxID=22663 RepID=A0A218WIT7_PUNGR|nr:hypothetical protein CDL15_Pgr017287 [Punica granatum]